MARIGVLFKFIVFYFSVTFLFAIPVFLFMDQYEWIVSAWIAAGAVFLLGLYVEPALLKIHRAHLLPPMGLGTTLDRVATNHSDLRGDDLPSVFVIQEPDRYVLVSKGWLGSGVIMLSQSLLASVTETELRNILRNALFALKKPGITLISIADLAASLVKRFLPGDGTKVSGLSPSGAFWFLAIYPFFRFFVWMGTTRHHQDGIRLAPSKSSL